MIALVIWSSAFAAPALLASAFVIEGPALVIGSIARADSGGWIAVGWQALANSIFGYGVWNWLLSRHPAAQVAPLSLMVPVFGMSASTLYLGEPLQPWKITAAMLVLMGLGVNMTRWRSPFRIAGR
jgi:O-acetylserine/cysteine efflux transporter